MEQKTKYTLSLNGPMDAIYRFIATDKDSRILHTSYTVTHLHEDTEVYLSIVAELSHSESELKRLLTLYKLHYSVLAVEGIPTTCPVVKSALKVD